MICGYKGLQCGVGFGAWGVRLSDRGPRVPGLGDTVLVETCFVAGGWGGGGGVKM